MYTTKCYIIENPKQGEVVVELILNSQIPTYGVEYDRRTEELTVDVKTDYIADLENLLAHYV